MLHAVRANNQDLQVLVRDLDPDAIPMCDVPDLWKEFVAIARLAESAATLLARRVEDGDTWRTAGFRSAAEQMAGESGTSVSESKRRLETSKRVKRLPRTAAAMRKGKLSPAKVEAIASAATVDPDAEKDSLDGAENKPLGELRAECLNAKGKDRDKAHARIHRDRYAREHIDGEGGWNLHARGTIADGARFRAKWQPLIDAQFKLARAEDRHESHDAYAFDALIELAERSGITDHADAASAEPTTETEPVTRPTPKRTPAQQDPPRLGPRHRQRQTTDGPTRRPPPPQQRTATRWMVRLGPCDWES